MIMKECRKNDDGELVCEECGKSCKTLGGLSTHIRNQHKNVSLKEYFDRWMKEEGDSSCKACGKETCFKSLRIGYSICCCKACENKNGQNSRQKAFMKKYGVSNPFQLESSKKKSRETCLANWGVEHQMRSNVVKSKVSKTNLAKYGVVTPFLNPDIRKKSIDTCMKNYGVHNPFESNVIKEKIKDTMTKTYGADHMARSPELLEKKKRTMVNRYGVDSYSKTDSYKKKIKTTCMTRYGVTNVSQDVNIHEKSLKNSFRLKKYKDTQIWYQGSYELDFLERYYDEHIDIERGPSIRYVFNDKNKVYHPDFYIPSLNLIIECKNSYLARIDKDKIEAKEKATVDCGFRYCMIVDEDYTKFDDMLNELNVTVK